MRRDFVPNPGLRWRLCLAPFGLCITQEQCRSGRHQPKYKATENRNRISNRKEDGSVSSLDCALSGVQQSPYLKRYTANIISEQYRLRFGILGVGNASAHPRTQIDLCTWIYRKQAHKSKKTAKKSVKRKRQKRRNPSAQQHTIYSLYQKRVFCVLGFSKIYNYIYYHYHPIKV